MMTFLLLCFLLILSVQLCLASFLFIVLFIFSFTLLRQQRRKRRTNLIQKESQIPPVEEAPVQDIQSETIEQKLEPIQLTTENSNEVEPKFSNDDDAQFLFERFTDELLVKSGYSKIDSTPQKDTRLRSYSSQTGDDTFQTTIVCLWKPCLIKGRIEWAKSPQLVSYRNYENIHKLQVILFIGLGGSPSAPASLSILPLNKVRSNVLSEIQLKAYEIGNAESGAVNEIMEPANSAR